MSSDEKQTPFQYYPPPPPTPANGTPVVFYHPQPVPYVQAVNLASDEALARSLQDQEQLLQVQVEDRSRGGCRRWGWGCKRQNGENGGRCAWMKDDGRPLGNLTSFMQGQLLGVFLPIFSLILAFGFETTKLVRIGALYGTANYFLVLAAVCAHHIGLFALVPLFLGFVFLGVSKKAFCCFLYVYKTRTTKTESEEVKVVSTATTGRCCSFILAALASFFFPILGTIIVLIARKNVLTSRYGAFVGLGCIAVVFGFFLALHGAVPVLLLAGLFLVQVSTVHFKRAIASVEAKEPAYCAL